MTTAARQAGSVMRLRYYRPSQRGMLAKARPWNELRQFSLAALEEESHCVVFSEETLFPAEMDPSKLCTAESWLKGSLERKRCGTCSWDGSVPVPCRGVTGRKSREELTRNPRNFLSEFQRFREPTAETFPSVS